MLKNILSYGIVIKNVIEWCLGEIEQMNDLWLELLERERGSHHLKKRIVPQPKKPYTPVDERKIEWFERLQDANKVVDDCGDEPSELELRCLALLASHVTNAIIRTELKCSYDAIKAMYHRLTAMELAEYGSNRRYRPTAKGYELLGIEPTEPPKKPVKRGQSIYFGGRR